MSIYLLFIIIIFSFSFLSTQKYKRCSVLYGQERICNANEFYLFIVGAFCILIPTLRSDIVGLDTIMYKEHMLNAIKMGYIKAVNESRFEPGYMIVQFIAGKYGGIILLQFLVSFIYIYSVCKLINRYSNMIWLSFLFYIIYGFYYLNFNEMRQAIAMGISCYSFKYLLQSNFRKYLIWILIASLFHLTSFILLPVYILSYIKKIKYSYIAICFIILIVMFKVADSLYDSLKLLSTVQYKMVEMEDEKQIRGLGLLLLQIATLLFGFIYRKNVENDRAVMISYLMLCYSILLFPICCLNPALFRLEQYSWLYMIILVPHLISYVHNKYIKNIIMIGYILVGVYYGLTNYYTVKAQIIPYMFFWEN